MKALNNNGRPCSLSRSSCKNAEKWKESIDMVSSPLSRLGYWLDNELSPLTYRSWIIRSIGGQNPAYRPIQDIGIVRNLIASPTILALFDLPWVPI